MKLVRKFVPTFILIGILIPIMIGSSCLFQRSISHTTQAAPSATIDLYGTFHAMGVTVDIDASDDPDGNATASLLYRQGTGAYQQGFPLSRVGETRFSGSLFWLTPGAVYDVQVTLHDPDGGPLEGTVLQASASTRAEISIPAVTRSYYVSPTGSGSTCSQASPCALSEGVSQAHAGEEVVLLGGTYHDGEISLPRSGTAGAPIVIRAMEGQTAVLDGGDPATFTWTAVSGGIYQTHVNVADPHLVTANGQRLYPYGSYQDLTNDIWGIPGFFADGTTVSVRLAGNANPNDANMVVSRYNHAFYVEQDYIYFQDLTFRHYGRSSYAKAISFNNASYNLVQGCTFAINDLGIGLKRASGENLIEDNEFYDTVFDWPWDAVKGGASLETGGVRFYSPTTGRGNVIRGNTFHDYFDGFGACPEAAGEASIENDVYDNLAYNIGDDGMETDGACTNLRIWNNTFHDVLMGISLAPVYTGPVYVIGNLIYNTGVGNNDYSGSPFKFNSGYDQSGPMYLFHNTADAALPGNDGIYIKAPGTWDLIYARNNIWSGTDYALNNYNEEQLIDFDYDDLYTTNPDEFVYWGDGTDRHMHDLPAFRALTGQELHGLNEIPDFTDASSADYTLDLTSPLIDAGVHIPGINDSYRGAAPDIGAFEYQGSGFDLIVTPISRIIAPGQTATYDVHIDAVGSFTGTVSLTHSAPPTGLLLDLSPTQIDAGMTAALTLTDTHTAPFEGSIGYTVTITGAAGAETDTQTVLLLVNPESVFIPRIMR